MLAQKRRYKDELEQLLHERTAQVDRLAYYDTLTSLPNRTLFEDRLAQAVALAQRADKKVAVLFIAPDQLKKVNDTFGHRAGDQLMQQVAVRLRGCVNDTDTVALRWRPICPVLPEIESSKDVVDVITSIQKALNPHSN